VSEVHSGCPRRSGLWQLPHDSSVALSPPTNDLAAQILLALYVQEPWQCHRKSALFSERYPAIRGVFV
jgi:hypothetical protein